MKSSRNPKIAAPAIIVQEIHFVHDYERQTNKKEQMIGHFY
jgi:hypothetical protein